MDPFSIAAGIVGITDGAVSSSVALARSLNAIQEAPRTINIARDNVDTLQPQQQTGSELAIYQQQANTRLRRVEERMTELEQLNQQPALDEVDGHSSQGGVQAERNSLVPLLELCKDAKRWLNNPRLRQMITDVSVDQKSRGLVGMSKMSADSRAWTSVDQGISGVSVTGESNGIVGVANASDAFWKR
ncbi:MAG: hypothetical protein Q9159_003823 [Coniocarpon cinnabarinum]